MTVLIEEVCSNLQQTTRDQQLVFNNHRHKMMVMADRDRIEQVLINIIGNAIKYSPVSGKVIIDTVKNGNNIFVDIRDNGIGIPQRDIENIFQRFYRVSQASVSYAGSGVGLYISSEIIKSHGGKLWAESEIGKGSVFHFSIPMGFLN